VPRSFSPPPPYYSCLEVGSFPSPPPSRSFPSSGSYVSSLSCCTPLFLFLFFCAALFVITALLNDGYITLVCFLLPVSWPPENLFHAFRSLQLHYHSTFLFSLLFEKGRSSYEGFRADHLALGMYGDAHDHPGSWTGSRSEGRLVEHPASALEGDRSDRGGPISVVWHPRSWLGKVYAVPTGVSRLRKD